jgi:hypothetical protein
MIDKDQLRDIIIKPTLIMLAKYSESAVNLLLGTAAQESAMGTFLVQKGIGFNGGIGIYQMECKTYHDTYLRAVESTVSMKTKFKLFFGYEGKPLAARLASDLQFATAMARLYYAQVQEPLPDKDDIEGLANYWKKYYNTSLGKGTTDEFTRNYKRYVASA